MIFGGHLEQLLWLKHFYKDPVKTQTDGIMVYTIQILAKVMKGPSKTSHFKSL